VDLYSASSRSNSNVLPLLVVGADLCKPVLQPGISATLRDHGVSRVVYHAICLFTPKAFARYSFLPATEDGLRLSRPGWFCAEVVYPSTDGHPLRH